MEEAQASSLLSLLLSPLLPFTPTDRALLVLPAGDSNISWRSGGFGVF